MSVPSLARRVCLLVLVAVGSTGAAPGQEPTPDPVIAGIRARLVERPEDPTLWFFLARRQARNGAKADALVSLRRLLEVGEGFLPDDGFASLAKDPAYRALRERFAARLPRVVGAPISFTLNDPRFLPEGIAYDPVGKDFYVGSIVRRQIVRVTLPAQWVRPWSEDGDNLGAHPRPRRGRSASSAMGGEHERPHRRGPDGPAQSPRRLRPRQANEDLSTSRCPARCS